MELKPGYKMTEVGVIPEDWEVKPLNKIAEVTSGKRLPAGYSVIKNKTPYPYIRVSDMYPGGVSVENIMYVPTDAAKHIKSYRIYTEDIFISVAGTLGIVGQIPKELNGANLTENADRITKITCYNKFLLYILLSDITQSVIDTTRTIGAQPKLALERIRNFLIPLPPSLSEQQAIAAALSDVDELLSSLDRLIAKKKDIRLATMQELLTGKKRLPGFRDNWVTFELGKCGSLQKQAITPSSCPHSVFYEYSMPAFDEDKKPFKVYGEKIYSNKLVIKGPVILFNKLNVRQRRVWLVNNTKSNSICSTEFLPYQTKKINLDLLKQILLTDEATSYFESCSTGTSNSQKRITPSIFLEYKCFLPSSLAEQQAIASVLSDMDAEIEALEARRDKVRNIKTGMMQELLTGKTRLISAGETA